MSEFVVDDVVDEVVDEVGTAAASDAVDCVVALSVASLNGCVSVVPSVSASSVLLSSSMMSALPPRFLNACHWLQKASEQQRDEFEDK